MPRNIIVNGYAYPSISPQVLANWLPDLTLLSNFSYGITADGDIINLEDANLIEAANAAGVKPLMVLTPIDETGTFNDQTASALLENPEARARLVENIESTIKSKGLYGIDFDFEYIPAQNKEQYVSLVNATREVLAVDGLLTTVALAPKTSADQRGVLYEGHDYAGMGAAADLVLLMTYEWGYTYGPPMAVAPINAVRRVLDFGVSQIPASKILMGMPNYGYDWTLPFVQGESRAEKVSNEEAIARAGRFASRNGNADADSIIQFDETAQSPFYNYTDDAGLEHVVWFENEASIRAKLALVDEYGFAGIAYWNIMDYFPANSIALNSLYGVVKI